MDIISEDSLDIWTKDFFGLFVDEEFNIDLNIALKEGPAVPEFPLSQATPLHDYCL